MTERWNKFLLNELDRPDPEESTLAPEEAEELEQRRPERPERDEEELIPADPDVRPALADAPPEELQAYRRGVARGPSEKHTSPYDLEPHQIVDRALIRDRKKYKELAASNIGFSYNVDWDKERQQAIQIIDEFVTSGKYDRAIEKARAAGLSAFEAEEYADLLHKDIAMSHLGPGAPDSWPASHGLTFACSPLEDLEGCSKARKLHDIDQLKNAVRTLPQVLKNWATDVVGSLETSLGRALGDTGDALKAKVLRPPEDDAAAAELAAANREEYGAPYDFNLEVAMAPGPGGMHALSYVLPSHVHIVQVGKKRGLYNEKTGATYNLPKKQLSNYSANRFYKK